MFYVFSQSRPPEPPRDIIPGFSGSPVAYDAMGLVNHNLGYPPPFENGPRDCNDGVFDGIGCIYYIITNGKARVLLRM